MQTQTAEILPPKRSQAKQKSGKGSGRYRPPKGVLQPGLIPWKPGQSGNPGGMATVYGDVLRAARTASPMAVAKLVELVGSPDDRVALMAADKLLERAWGKPKEIQDDKTAGPPDLGALSAGDLAELRRIAGKMRGNADSAPTAEAPDSATTATVGAGAASEPEPIAVDVPD